MKYSIKEIIDIAIGLEKTGFEFYTKCGERFKDEDIAEIFSFLAKEEQEHKKIFESMIKSDEKPSGIFTEEYYLYLKSIAVARVYKDDLEQVLNSINSPIEAVQKALMDEKESILFYNEVKNLYNNDSKAVVLLNKIIEEERKHLLTLVDLMEKIKS